MANKHTIIYQSHFELMDNLSDEQAGILIKSIGLFQKGIEPKISDPMVFGIFLAIKRDFIIQSENYDKKVKANRENGAKGGRPKVSINPNNPVGLLVTQPNPNNLKDKEKDNGLVLSISFQIDKEDAADLIKDLQAYIDLPTFKGIKDYSIPNPALEEAKKQNESKNKLAKEMQRVFVDVFDDEYLATKFATTYKLDALNREIEVLQRKLNKI